MKVGIAIACLCSLVTVGHALAQQSPLTYPDLVKAARTYEKLEGGERIIPNRILFHTVKLDLKAFGNGSDAYFVRKADEIAFICQASSPGFKGGAIIGEVVKHEEGAEGSHVYTLKICTASTK